MDLEQFWVEYQGRVNRALKDPPELDVEAMAAAFADSFIAATPAGVMCGRNDQQLRDFLPKGMDFYRRVGTKSMRIASTTATPLDEFHTMSKVHWVADYVKPDGSKLSLEFDVIYLIQHSGGCPRIFGWITGDEMALLRANGLVVA